MSIFEIIMILCFGIAWPFSIWKSWTSRSNGGKSFMFLLTALLGYIAGVLHKIYYNPDPVLYLYIINLFLISVDMYLFLMNAKLEKAKDKLSL